MQPRAQKPYQQLQGIDALFGEDTSTANAKQFAPLSVIRLPAHQPRRYFDPQKLTELIESVKQHGILENLLVRPLPGGHLGQYELVAGERRFRAAKEVGLEEVPITVRELTEEEALEVALVENLQREDLNPVEETEGLLQLLASRLGSTPNDVIALLNRKAYLNRQTANPEKITDNVIRDQWLAVEKTFALVGKFSPESFRVNRLPLLNLPNEVLDALRQGKIAYTKAKTISRLKDISGRKALLEEAVINKLSLSQIQERIEAALRSKEAPMTIKFHASEVMRRYNKSKAWDNPKKQKRLMKLIAEMEALLTEP